MKIVVNSLTEKSLSFELIPETNDDQVFLSLVCRDYDKADLKITSIQYLKDPDVVDKIRIAVEKR